MSQPVPQPLLIPEYCPACLHNACGNAQIDAHAARHDMSEFVRQTTCKEIMQTRAPRTHLPTHPHTHTPTGPTCCRSGHSPTVTCARAPALLHVTGCISFRYVIEETQTTLPFRCYAVVCVNSFADREDDLAQMTLEFAIRHTMTRPFMWNPVSCF